MIKTLELNRFAKGAEVFKAKATNNCVIYTRVSTKEQADTNLSLETQRKGCDAYVLRYGYNVLAYFGGTYESAQTDERKEFKRMIEFSKKQKSKVSYIIVYSLERFSRTGDNAIWLSRQLRDLGITIISVTQPIDTSNPAGVLQQNILFLFGQYDNDLRKQKSMEGTKEKLIQGIWCTKPPQGYDTVRKNGERAIEINAGGRLLRKAFLWKANEGYQKQLRELEQKVERLEERFINEEIKPDLYEKFADKFRQERREIEDKIKGCPVSGSNLEYYINRSVELASELPSLWASSDYSTKQKLQNLVFPEGIYYIKKKDQSRTTKINSVFLSIARLQQFSGQKETGTSEAIFKNSGWVVPTGIEC